MNTLTIFALITSMTFALNAGAIFNPNATACKTAEAQKDNDSITQQSALFAYAAMKDAMYKEQLWFEAMKAENILLQTNVIEDRNLLHVKVELADLQGGIINVKNERGDIVWTSAIQPDEPSLEFYLDMKRFPKGSYYVEATQTSQVVSPRFQVN